MVLGIITSLAACPAIIGTNEAVMQGQRKNAKERHRGLKSNLFVSCSTTTRSGREVNGSEVVLQNNKLYLSTPSVDFPDGHEDDHPFAGYFLPYPDHNWGRKGEGLVSTISDDPPQLNWIYVDEDTHEVKYGNREESEPHVVGPWDCTPADKRITLEGWEGFLAVRDAPGEWALYFDRDDDSLEGIVPREKKRMEVELVRKERRQRKPKPDDD